MGNLYCWQVPKFSYNFSPSQHRYLGQQKKPDPNAVKLEVARKKGTYVSTLYAVYYTRGYCTLSNSCKYFTDIRRQNKVLCSNLFHHAYCGNTFFDVGVYVSSLVCFVQQKFDMCSIVEREHRSRKGGFGALQHALHETRDRIAATRGGQEYKKHVQRCQVSVADLRLV